MAATDSNSFRDPVLVSGLIRKIQNLAASLESSKCVDTSPHAPIDASFKAHSVAPPKAHPNNPNNSKPNTNRPNRPIRIMEVCGTHTVAIARAGFRSVMPANIKLLSGPGCPVCVTANADIDSIIACTRIPNSIVATFGDMLRVPGSSSSLQQCKTEGAAVQVVYSPLDAIKLAQDNASKNVIFAGVGFETTAPLVAASIKRAAALNLKNFFVVTAHKLVPPALRALINDPDLGLDALILPGHVSTVIGVAPYEFIAKEFGVPAVVTGFEPVDILQGISQLLTQLANGKTTIEIAYSRAVMPSGNPVAVATMNEVFAPCDANWRGFGLIPNSGLTLREEYVSYDALKRFAPEIEATKEHQGCLCGEVLRGTISASDCPLFGKVCVPANPIGPCMVSSEGSCAAHYRYQIVG
jgi:hydrogenase expression/formation protein HypD